MNDIETNAQKLFKAKCSFYWPILRPVWDPKSRLHFLLNTVILKRLHREEEPTIPPHILLSACRYGQVMLAGDAKAEALQSAIKQNVFSPHSPKHWNELLAMTDKELEVELLILNKLGPRTTCRPTRYEPRGKQALRDPAYKGSKNQRFHYGDRYLTVPFKRHLSEASNYVEELFARCKIKAKELHSSLLSPSVPDRANKYHDILFKSISTSDAGERGNACSICKEPLRDQDKFHLKVSVKAREFAKFDELPNCMTKSYDVWTKQHVNELDGLIKEFEDNVASKLAVGTRSRLLSDLREFATSIVSANKILDKIERENSYCFEPTELPCGHLFGLKCISSWIVGSDNKTCPMCRAKLPELSTAKAPEASREPVDVSEVIVVGVRAVRPSAGGRRRSTGRLRLRG